MFESINRILAPFYALSLAKRMVIVGTVAASMLGFVAIVMLSNRVDYRTLYSNLSTEDATEIARKLKDQKIPYELAGDNRVIMVPSDKVHELRLSMAADGLPQGGGVGFELFDKKMLGMTEFSQKLNYKRALQGELARTVSQIAGVESARVHLTIPDRSVFSEREKLPQASVIVRMKNGKSLSESEVGGISHLVSSAVEGLVPELVTIIDSRGKVVNKPGIGADPSSKRTTAMLETQATYERQQEERLQSLLDKALGTGKTAARVTATFDFKQIERFEERYDPESPVLRSEQKSEEKLTQSAGGGVPGVQPNLGRTGPGGIDSTGQSKSDTTANFEISRMTSKIIEPTGALMKVSVAIMVDGKYEAGPDGKAKYSPRTPEELRQIEELVKGAIGFNQARGDAVTVANIPFQDAMPQVEQLPGSSESQDILSSPLMFSLLRYALLGALFLFVYFVVLRPMIRIALSGRSASVDVISQMDIRSQALEAQMKQQMNQATLKTHADMVEKVKTDPYQAAQIIQNWIKNRE